MKNAVALILALASPLLFPWPLAVPLVLVASVILPPAGILAGVLADMLYYTHPVGVPYATLVGALLTVIGFFVHRFWRTRIMSA